MHQIDTQVPVDGVSADELQGLSGSRRVVPPPQDLSYIQPFQDGRGMLLAPAASWDWRAMSGVTPVKNQNPYGTCWAFAAVGDFESKVLISESVVNDYSELNIQACNPTSNDCNAGGNAWMSTNYLSVLGSVDETCDTYPGGCPTPTCVNPACTYFKQVTEWRVIPNDVASIKAAVQTYGPVYTSMYASFPGFSTYDGNGCLSYTGPEDPNHGVLIVGFDADLCGTGVGGWIVKNSWGTGWGDNGYFYIQYENARIGESSNVITGYTDYDPNMTMYYWDEWGWWSSVGYGDGNDHAVVEFTPQNANEYVHSIHFWATAGPTTYTIYIYDDFDGNAPTNLLRQSLNHSFDEAGYHSVALASPLPVAAGDDVVVVVKVTNDSYNYPLPRDQHGPPEAGRTYTSHSGASWSASSYDVAIRLRTSAAPAPNVGVTKQVIGSDFAPGDPLTFTLTIANSGNEVAARVVVTDDMPSEVLNPTFASTLALTPTGVLSYVWNVEPLGTGDSGVITIYGQIDPGLASGFSFANMAIISDPEDNTPGNNTSSVTVGECRVYLPLVIRNYPPPPPSTLYSAGDACVLQGYPTTNFGDTSDMWAGYDDYLSPDGKIVRSLIQFDVSAIPSGISHPLFSIS